jgi:hypothetical protein
MTKSGKKVHATRQQVEADTKLVTVAEERDFNDATEAVAWVEQVVTAPRWRAQGERFGFMHRCNGTGGRGSVFVPR